MSMTFSVRITDRTPARNLLVSFDKETKWNSNSLRSWLCRKYAELNGGEIYIYINESIPSVIEQPASQADAMFQAQAIDAANAVPVGGWEAFERECDQDAQEVASYEDVSDSDYPILAQVIPQAPFFATQRAIDEADAQFQAFCDDHDDDDLDLDVVACAPCKGSGDSHDGGYWHDCPSCQGTGVELAATVEASPITIGEAFRLHPFINDHALCQAVLTAVYGEPESFIDWNEFGGESPASFLGMDYDHDEWEAMHPRMESGFPLC